MLTSADFEALARTYGRVGGMDRMATLVKAIRAERGAERVLLLDGGDTLQGSYTALAIQGRRHGRGDAGAGRRGHHRPLGVHARRRARRASCSATSISRALRASPSWPATCATPISRSRCFTATRMFEKGGVSVAVIGQAFPYTPIANPRWMMPELVVRHPRGRRAQNRLPRRARKGAEVVVLLSHNGFDVDRKLAGRVRGHRRHPHRATRTMRCRQPMQVGQHAAGRLRLARQVPVAPRPRGGGRARHGLRLRADPGAGRCDRARSGHGAR